MRLFPAGHSLLATGRFSEHLAHLALESDAPGRRESTQTLGPERGCMVLHVRLERLAVRKDVPCLDPDR